MSWTVDEGPWPGNAVGHGQARGNILTRTDVENVRILFDTDTIIALMFYLKPRQHAIVIYNESHCDYNTKLRYSSFLNGFMKGQRNICRMDVETYIYMQEKTLKINTDLYFVFADFEKAFDRVRRGVACWCIVKKGM